MYEQRIAMSELSSDNQRKFKPIGISAGEWLSLCALGLIIFMMAFSALQQNLAEAISWKEQPFDATEWKAGDKRYAMAKDLVERQKLNGMTSAEVVQLLGNPDKESVQTFIYDTGQCQSCVANGSLTIHIAGNTVTDVEVVRPQIP
jgi:hypothetical protein